MAAIPFGYREWLMRCLSGKLKFVWKWGLFEQIGRICMNLCVIKWVSEIKVGDEIQLVSTDVTSENTIYKLAVSADTITYEILVKLDDGIRREVI